MCIFCSILRDESPASFIYQDDLCVAFLNIRPIHEAEFMVIPREHIDHFTDLPDDLAAHIMVVAQKLARKLLVEFKPQRIGYVVHGFGVPHAHLNVIPLHDSSDIISAKHVHAKHGEFVVSLDNIAAPTREELDVIATRFK